MDATAHMSTTTATSSFAPHTTKGERVVGGELRRLARPVNVDAFERVTRALTVPNTAAASSGVHPWEPRSVCTEVPPLSWERGRPRGAGRDNNMGLPSRAVNTNVTPRRRETIECNA